MPSEKKLLIDYAKQVAKAFKKSPLCHGYGAYLENLVKEGVFFEGMESTSSHADTKAWKRRKRPKIKECYYNSQNFVLDYPEATYFECLCFTGLLPFDHAWIVLDGKLFDFTLELIPAAAKPCYLGLPVPLKFFAKVIAESGQWESVGPLYYVTKKTPVKRKSKRKGK